MKKSAIYRFLPLLLALFPILAASCSKDEIIFDHEMPQFETRPGMQLLEVIMPNGTLADEKICIVGEFNGGLEAATSDARWQLEKAPGNDIKWGIYLNPSDFIDGKTLADGYYFYSASEREERGLLGEEAVHYEAPAVGGRINVTVNRWAAYFDKPVNPDEITHDGYVLYVIDNSGYDELALYAWGDAEAFGGWPGITPTGTVTVGSTTYKYFDTGEANKGLGLNLIFNNNGNGSQLPDFGATLDRDYYLELTPEGVKEVDAASSVVHDGFVVYALDITGWDALYLYQWGEVNDLGGAWPGVQPTGTETINGIEFKYFDMGEANAGLGQNLIFNNGNGTQLGDFGYTIDHDVYLEVSASGAKEIDPATYGGGGTTEPEQPAQPAEPTEPEEPAETHQYTIYIEDLTGFADLWVYAWGDKEMFGKWPGANAAETVTLDGTTYRTVKMQGAGEGLNLIFHDNNGTQYDALGITADKDYYITANPSSASLKE